MGALSHGCGRRSLRLREYDYSSPGIYFVTICVEDRGCLLGRVDGLEVVLGPFGEIAAESWEWLGAQYAYLDLDAWVIMPNHLHGVLVIEPEPESRQVPGGSGGSRTAPTEPIALRRKTLGRLVGAFKTVSSKRINALRGAPGAAFWQRNYYEHIVRNDRDLERVRAYIAENPWRWFEDPEHPDHA